MFRHSCGKCPYANIKRPSDITIADFWGWEKTDPNINADNKGVSLILVNTEKGRELFDKIRDHMDVIPAKLENCLQPNLRQPTAVHPKRAQFEREYQEKGFEYVFKKYGKEKILDKIRKLTRRIKRKIKKVLGI